MIRKFFLIVLTLVFANSPAFSQDTDTYTGKFYVAQIRASCFEMTNGGCMVYQHCVLKFDTDSVEVSYLTTSSCSPSELEIESNSNDNVTKKYKWSIVAAQLEIKNFEDYSKYSFQERDSTYVNSLFTKANVHKNVDSETLVYYKYIGGKPSSVYMEAERKVATKWGVVMDYTTGDCTSRYDYKASECEIKNQPLFEYLNQKFGENWKSKFDKDVEAEMKALLK